MHSSDTSPLSLPSKRERGLPQAQVIRADSACVLLETRDNVVEHSSSVHDAYLPRAYKYRCDDHRAYLLPVHMAKQLFCGLCGDCSAYSIFRSQSRDSETLSASHAPSYPLSQCWPARCHSDAVESAAAPALSICSACYSYSQELHV